MPHSADYLVISRVTARQWSNFLTHSTVLCCAPGAPGGRQILVYVPFYMLRARHLMVIRAVSFETTLSYRFVAKFSCSLVSLLSNKSFRPHAQVHSSFQAFSNYSWCMVSRRSHAYVKVMYCTVDRRDWIHGSFRE